MENEEVRAASVGQTLALSVALNALIAHHPQRNQVLATLRKQHEVGASFFLGEPLPDVALDAFCKTLKFVMHEDSDQS